MSEQMTGNPTPVATDSVQEVQGIFPTDVAMEDAIAKLTLAGFDRADLSLPVTSPSVARSTPDLGADTPMTDTDTRQARNMGTGMAGSIGALAAAGATIATGGAAAVAIAAAAAVGAGSALAANAVGTAARTAQADEHDAAARDGKLVLAVHAATGDKQMEAERIMRAAGATEVGTIVRATAASSGIDSAGWTG